MSTRDGFDDLVAARLRDTAPQEAPAHLMDSLINRVSSTPQRRRGALGWLNSPVARLAVAAAVLAAAVVAGIQFGGLFDRPIGAEESSPSPSASIQPSPSASIQPSSPEASASAATTPQPSAEASATPGAGDPSELLLRLETICDVSPPQSIPRISLMADGTVVWHSNASELPIQTRQLTADGLAEMTDDLFTGGLFDESATYEPVQRPGTPEPPGHGACFHTYTADDGAVVVGSTSWFGEPEESTYYEPAPERKALDELASALLDPESLVADAAWAGPASTYEGTEYQLLLHAVRDSDVPSTGSPDASEVPWPFDSPLDEFGEPGFDETYRCGNISRDEAMAIVDALIKPDAEHPVLTAPYYFSLQWAEGNGSVEVNLVPLMPDGYPGCAGPL